MKVRGAKLEDFQNRKANLMDQNAMTVAILTEQQNKIRMRHYHLDPMSQLAASQRSGMSQGGLSDEVQHPEDEKLRQVLDEIDIKIGQSIEEKELEQKSTQLLQKQIKEAKDCFTNAYKQYQAIRQADSGAHGEPSSARFNDQAQGSKNSVESVREKMKHMINDQYSSIDYRNSLGEKGPLPNDQFMSFSQNSITTPFKQVDNLIYADSGFALTGAKNGEISGKENPQTEFKCTSQTAFK